MSFLNQLKSQAQTIQAQQSVDQQSQLQTLEAVERCTHQAWRYLDELAAQLRVLQPDGPRLSADGKTPWPAMRASDFRVDARRKSVQGRELFDYVLMAWTLMPKMGVAVQGSVSSGLLAEMQQIESRLGAGQVQFERFEKRIPPRNSLQSVRYDYQTQARGMVRLQPDHVSGNLEFRLVCVTGLEVRSKSFSAAMFPPAQLDELAKLLVGQSSSFLQ
jgi:hypothetical protein